MAKGKESTIIYDKHVEICSEYLSDEQFGKLMFTLTMGRDPDFGDDKLLSMAYAFISLQKKLDDEKYRQICERNRKNGAKGGRPKKNPNKANGFFKNPNDNENDNENDNDNENEKAHDDELTLGTFKNVHLTDEQYSELASIYERPMEIINKVSVWLSGATNDVPDHYGLCIKFATNDRWPRRKIIEPVEPIRVEDPLSEEEQERKVADMRARLKGAIKSM